ncbi:phage tail tape measure protein [Streptomyces sp. B1866]|uniref:phage tail tape measure protein n=1 Tax=Streptomyces sp. B1866 TaxID=3075431 RepID=UPI00288D9AA6|nr:phage tail tape measure protein [Streptomyces sp. B1866]MDT3395596.1 phage tail tape measure protein [Streptomyces sp. B1866]
MALTVGQLLVTIDVDDSPLQGGLARVERAVVATAEKITAEAASAGEAAGQQLGDAVADGAEDGGQAAGGRLRDRLGAFGWAAVGASVGAAVVAGLGEAMSQQRETSLLAAQLGADPAQAKRLGKAAGALYSRGYTDSVSDANEALKALWQQGLVPAGATEKELEKVGGRLSQVAQIMGEEVGPTSVAVGQMLKTGMARNADEAFDILTRGTQLGINKAEDLLDTFNEYSIQFRDLGIDGKQALGIMHQGLQAGARDADIVADAMKELNIRVKDGSAADGLKSLGLNADQMARAFATGGPKARAALDTITDRLRAVKDPTERFRLAQQLLGTQSEDLSRALLAIDPSKAVASLGRVDGAAKRAGDTMRDNAATKVTVFTRSLRQGFVEILGNRVLPILTTAGSYLDDFADGLAAAAGFVARNGAAFSVAAGIITLVMLPTLVQLGTQATVTTGQVVAGWIAQSAAGVAAGARFVAANTLILAGWVRQGAAASLTALRVVAAWVLMGGQSLVQAGRMAAAWVIALGPVGWVLATVAALVALIIVKWDTVTSATGSAWDWVSGKVSAVARFLLNLFMAWTIVGVIIRHWDAVRSGTTRAWNATTDWVRGVPQRIIGFFARWTIAGLIASHWKRVKDGTVREAGEMLTFVSKLPDTIAGYFGDFGDLLYDEGRDVVRGLWNGIKSMGDWLKSTLSGWAKKVIPGPIKKALGIGSPSRVMAREVGRWIPADVVAGIRSGQGAVARTMARLVTPPPLPPVPAFAAASGPPAPPGYFPGRPAVHIEHWHGGTQTPQENAAALEWRMKARG